MNDYETYIAAKSKAQTFEQIPAPKKLAKHLYPHQADLVRWAMRKGRAAIFADTGLGKTAMQVEWARHVSAHGRVLILAPLAVAEQTVREAARFDVAMKYLRADDGETPIVIANYEMLEHFDASRFTGIVLDESSILKAYDGATRTAIIEAFSKTRWRLACTATPAPNDHTELGNHSEFLGIKTRVEMLSEYFCHDGGETQVWRIKGHAEETFWRWVGSWGAIVKRPSDLGHDDAAFILPPLNMHEKVVEIDHRDAQKVGLLFAPDVISLADQRATRRATMDRRVAVAAEIAKAKGPLLIWCELNDEGDALEESIPGAVQVRGADSPESKVDRLLGFAEGRYRVLITKPSIAGHGMNWQHCSRMVFLGASHSYEQTYQAIRRCYRFGQKSQVDVYTVRAATEGAIVANYRRKEAEAERMAVAMTEHTREIVRSEIGTGGRREWNEYDPKERMTVPSWIGQEAS